MKHGPEKNQRSAAPYLPPRNLKPVVRPGRYLPPSVRIGKDLFGGEHHEYLQGTGLWARCGGRGRCRECMKEVDGMTTRERLISALEEHLGYSHLKTIGAGVGIFTGTDPGEGRCLGDHIDRVEMLTAIEAEFQISMPEDVAQASPSLEDLLALVEERLRHKRGDGE